MKTWYFAKLNVRYSPSAASELINLLIVNFSTLEIGYGVFSISDIDTGVVTFYFMPQTLISAKYFSLKTTPCTKPSFKGLGLVLGDENSWKHFADIG